MRPEPIQNIKLSFQCSEKWDNMEARDNGRFCASCSKKVYDFTDKSASDVHKAYELNKGKLCGRFKVSQAAVVKRNSRIKRLVSALLLVFGSNLFTTHFKAEASPISSPDRTGPGDISYRDEEYIQGIMIEYPLVYKFGSDDEMYRFINTNINYPEDTRAGKVFVSFFVTATGTVRDVKILKGIKKDIDREIIRVVNLLEFIPMEIDGKRIETSHTLSIPVQR